MATDVARLALQIDVNGAQRARQALRGLQDGSIKATRASDQLVASTARLSNTARGSGGSFRLMKGSIQQVGFQVGDFATQVSAGQSAIVAFGQQASQLAGIMGPGGAVLGAVIAIGAGIAGAFVRGMGEGEEATKSLREQIDELNLSFNDLTKNQREALELERARGQQQANKRIAEQREELEKLRETESNLLRLQSMAANDPGLADVFNADDLRETQDEITELAGKIDTAEKRAEHSRKAFDEMLSGIGADDANEEIESLTKSLQFQIETFGASERVIQLAKIAQLEKNGADSEAVRISRNLTNAYYDKLDAYSQEAERLKLLREQYKITASEDPLLQRVSAQDRGGEIIQSIRARAQAVRDGLDQEFAIRQAHNERVMALNDALRLGVIDSVEERNRLEVESARRRNEELLQLESQKNRVFTSGQEKSLQLTGQFFGNLASIAEKGGEESFQRYKNLASSQAAIAAALSIASVLGDPTIPPLARVPLALSLGALAGVQVAEIQSQEYQGSYLGGGYTGGGSRTGGLDGQGGFPAILHPNETVIDHTKGQSMGGMSVSFQVIDQSTGNHDYQTEETTDQDGQRRLRVIIRDTVNNNIARGEHDRAMGSRFDLKSKGRRV